MEATSVIQVLINAKDEASQTLKGITGHLKELGTSAKEYMGEGFKEAAEVGAEGLLAFGEIARESIGDAQKYNQQLAGLSAELISTKGASGMTVDSLKEMADQMERTTGINKSAILSAANMELTFTSIGKQVFPDVTQSALDMATAFNNGALPNAMQLQEQMIQLGKALNDPAKGLHALQRVGVSFSKTETAAIKTAMAHNDILGAQKVMLGELSNEFGGRAAAAGNTFYGTLAKLNNVVESVKEKMGNLLIKALTPLIGKITEFIGRIDWEAVTNKAESSINSLTVSIMTFVKPIAAFLSEHSAQIIGFFRDYGKEIAIVIPIMGLLYGAFVLMTNPLLGVIAAVVVLTVAWKEIHAWWERGGTTVKVLSEAFQALWGQLKSLWDVIRSQLLPAFAGLWQQLSPILIPALKILGAVLGEKIFIGITAVIGAVRVVVIVFSDFLNVVKTITSELNKLFDAIGKIGGVSSTLSNLMKAGGGAVSGIEHFIEHRATGGSVSAGQMYNVNEREPEFFTPTQGGTVTPLSKMPAGTGGGHTITLHMNNPQIQSTTQAQMLGEMMGRSVLNAINGAY